MPPRCATSTRSPHSVTRTRFIRRLGRHAGERHHHDDELDDEHDDDHHDHHDHDDDCAGTMSPRSTIVRRQLSVRARSRRANELGLGLMAVVIIGGGYVLLLLADKPDVPPDLWVFLAAVLGLDVAADLAVRRFAPRADPTLLPIAALLNGIGFIAISRPSTATLRIQAGWTAVAVGAFVATLVVVRHTRTLERYRYTFLLLGVAAFLLPPLPGIGREINGALEAVGARRTTELPARRAAVLLVIFFAAYLVDKRELLTSGTQIPRARSPRPEAPRAVVARVGFLDPRDGPSEGSRVVASSSRPRRNARPPAHPTPCRTWPAAFAMFVAASVIVNQFSNTSGGWFSVGSGERQKAVDSPR